jgi:hypothetical protein
MTGFALPPNPLTSQIALPVRMRQDLATELATRRSPALLCP